MRLSLLASLILVVATTALAVRHTGAQSMGAQGMGAQDMGAALLRGENLMVTNCAPCHAVGRTGDSPRADAPTFRSLSKKYPIESLAESLAEGLFTGHPDMPEFTFEAPDVGAILAYLESIQER